MCRFVDSRAKGIYKRILSIRFKYYDRYPFMKNQFQILPKFVMNYNYIYDLKNDFFFTFIMYAIYKTNNFSFVNIITVHSVLNEIFRELEVRFYPPYFKLSKSIISLCVQ